MSLGIRDDHTSLPTPADPAEHGDGVDLQHYLSVIFTRKWFLLAFLTISLGAGALHTYTQVPIFQATATVLIQPGEVRVMGGIQGIEDPVAKALATQYQILSSRRIAEPVWVELGFDRRLSIGAFMEAISVASDKNSQVVRVGFRSPNAVDTSRVANALVESYMRDNRQRAVGITDEGLKKLRAKSSELEDQVQKGAKLLAQFREKHPELPIDGTPTVASTRLDSLNHSLVETEALRIAKEAEIAAQESGGVEASDSERFHELRLEVQRLEEERTSLLQRVREGHPLIKQLEERLRSARHRVELAHLAVLAAARSELRSIQQREEALRREVETLATRMVESSQNLVHLRLLQENHARLVDAHREVSQRINEIELSESTATRDLNVYWMERADAPIAPILPNHRRNLLMAFLLGIAGGIGLCFLVDYLDRSLKSKDEVERLLRLPVIGFVPLVEVEEPDRPLELQGATDPRSQVGEAFRTVRTGVSYGALGDSQGRARKVMLTSTLPRDGKTLCSVNLALAFAHQGKRTLLIDCDLRKPRLRAMFSIQSESGLSSFLADEEPLDRLATALHPTADVPCLTILPSGPMPPNPADLLNSERMKEVLEHLEGRFDWIVLDAPPSSLSDPVILSTHVHNVVFVVRSFVTPRDLAIHAVAQFAGVKARMVGVILNNASLPKSSMPFGKYGYGYGGYGYGYGYGYGREKPARSTSRTAVVRTQGEAKETGGSAEV